MKRIASILLAGVLMAGMTLSACKKKENCQHNVGTWEITTPPTCQKEGTQKGICGICYEELFESVPADSNAHVYGAWAITQPTETEVGKAVKTCTENSEHLLTQTLPVLGDTGYESSITVRPTAGKDGTRAYTLQHAEGDIQFETTVPATGIQTVRDAVELGSSKESVAFVRSADGTMGTQFVRPWDEKEPTTYFGENNYIPRALGDAVVASSTERAYDTGHYSDKLTLAKGKEKGGFAINGGLLQEAFEGTPTAASVSAVYFWVYNNDESAHRYTLYPQASGGTAGVYEGELTAKSWTEISITKAMWEEMASLAGGAYAKGKDGDILFTNALKDTEKEADHVFYLDCFRKTRLREVESYANAGCYLSAKENVAFTSMQTEHVYAGEYSDKLTLGSAKSTGVFALSGAQLRASLELIVDEQTGSLIKPAVHSTRFKIYNADDVAHSYELYSQMTGKKSAGEYTGTLVPHAWTTVYITRLMWEEAIEDPSKKYTKDNGADIVITNESADNAEKTFYVDYFYDLVTSSLDPHSYEFGDNYTHIYNGTDDCDRWYYTVEETVTDPVSGETYTEEVVYGLTNWDGKEDGKIRNDLASNNGSVNFLNGSKLFLQYANDLGYFYGVEGGLERLYNSARWSTNDDFKEWTEEVDGEVVYCFSFGSIQNSGDSSGYFAVLNVRFTLAPTFAVTSLSVTADIYVNNASQEEGDTALKTWSRDEKGKATVIEGQELGARYVSTIDFTQEMVQEGVAAPENPHTPDKMFVNDFEILYHGEPLAEGEKAEFASGKSTQYIFAISDIKPSTALTSYLFDSFSFYLRTVENGDVIDKRIDADTMASVGMTAYLNPETYEFFLNAKHSGEQTVVVKSQNVEKIIPCLISERTPTKLLPSVHQYTNGQYVWNTYSSNSATIQDHYRGQPLYFTADVPPSEKNYASASHKVSIIGSSLTTYQPIENAAEMLTQTSRDGQPATQFMPTENGIYIITITSNLNVNVTAMMIIYVIDPPTLAELVTERYAANLEYPTPTNVLVRFADLQEVKTEDVVTGYTAMATLTNTEGITETLKCTYTVETAQMVSVHATGAKLGYKLYLNEAYDFILSHDSGFGFQEEVALHKIEAPDFTQLTASKYTQTLTYPTETVVNVEFSNLTEVKTEDVVTGYTVTATIKHGDEVKETLTCTYTLADKTLVSVHASGEELGYQLFFGGRYELTLSHEKGAGEREEVLLKKVLESAE